MRLISSLVLFLIAFCCINSKAFAGLTKVQKKALSSLNTENGAFEVFALDQLGSDHSVAFVGVDYSQISKAEKKSLANTLAAFKEVYVQETDLTSAIHDELLERSKSGSVMVIKKPLGSWFQSYLYPCATVFSGMATSMAFVMNGLSADLSQVILVAAGGTLTYLNYKKWVGQEKRANDRKVLHFSKYMRAIEGQSLVVTDQASAVGFGAGLLGEKVFEEREVPVCRTKVRVEPVEVELSVEEQEQERLRLEAEAEQERLQYEKLVEAERKKAEARKAQDALELQRVEEERVRRDWERTERERKKLEKKALKSQPNW